MARVSRSTRVLRLASAFVSTAVVAAGLALAVEVVPVAAIPATVLVNETFTGATVADPLIRGTGASCLTGATASTAQLNACPTTQSGPVPARGTTPGYLQLTDTGASKTGAVFYNRPVPSSAGIDATFDLYQYGGTGADGITFFLVDGATQLTATGAPGGSLGYAQRFEPGILGGYLGIGFDVFGNYYDDGENRGKGCPEGQRAPTTNSGAIAPNTITVRGPGSGNIGYCFLASTTTANSIPNKPTSSLPGKLAASTLAGAKRTFHVVITPGSSPLIDVQVDFGGGLGFQTVIDDLPAPPGAPASYKFGFSGSTGGSTDVHLLGNVVVGTVNPLGALNLIKQVNRQTPLPAVLVAGSSIPYQFVVTNSGLETLHGLAITDPGVASVACFTGDIPPAPDPASTVVCTGSHVVTADEVLSGQVVNVAVATALDPVEVPINSNQATVTVALRASLGLTKNVTTAGPYRVGQAVGYSYTVTNTGGAALANVAVADNRVAGVSCPTSALAPAASVACTGTYTIRLQDIAGAGTLTNTATASGTTAIGQTAQSAAATRTIPVAANLTLSKTVDNPAPVVGQNAVFTVTVTNLGPSAARNVVVSAPLPTGTTFVSVNPTLGTHDGASGLWTIPALAVNESAVLTETDRVDSPNAIVNSATVVSAEQPDLNPGNESASVILNPIVPTTDLAVLKSFDSNAIRVGGTATATITVNNEGPFPATGVTVRDPLPSLGAEFVSAVGTGSYDAETGIWTVGDLAFPGTASIQLTARATAPGFVLNTAALVTVSPVDINPANDVATAPITVDKALADLAVGKSVRPADSALLGEPVSFVVTATNNGPDTSPSVVVDDALPPGLAFVSATAEVGTFDSATGQWTIGALAAGTSVMLEMSTTAIAAGHQSNLVAVTDAAINDPDGSNNAANASLQIDPLPVPPVDVGVTKQLSAVGDVSRTDPITFVVTAFNTGPNTATGVQITDPLPLGLQFVAATPSQGDYDELTGLWDVGTVGVGIPPTLSISAIVTGDPGDYTNTASLTAVDQVDTNNQNDSASVAWHVHAEADLSVTKTVSPTLAGPSDTVTYTVTVTNHGPEPDTGIQLVETNRTPAVFTSIVATKGTFDPPSLVWTIGDLAVDESATITVQVLVTTPAHVLNRTVVFSADLPDPNLLNNEASATLDVPGADLAVTKTVDAATTAIGSPVTFSVGVTNHGPDTALGVTVADPLPSGLSFGSASATVGFYDEGAGAWTVGDLAPGSSANLTLVATPSVSGAFTNTATASATSPPDFEPSNNSASATVTAAAAGLKFVPIEPTRVLDTREGIGGVAVGKVPAGGTVSFPVIGGEVPAGAKAVALNLTMTLVEGSGYATAWPTGEAMPATSSVNVSVAGETAANAAVLTVGAGGKIDMLTKETAHLVADLTGYWIEAGTTIDGRLHPAPTPVRLMDTRDGTGGKSGGFGPGESFDLQISGPSVPADATAVALTVTYTAAQSGFLTLWPTGTAQPTVSTANPNGAGDIRSNLAAVKIGAGGKVSIYSLQPAHVVVDLVAYFSDDAGTVGLFTPLSPQRVADTRLPNQPFPRVPAGTTATMSFAQLVPAQAAVVLYNLTVTDTDTGGYVTAYDADEARPLASSVNWSGPEQNRAAFTGSALGASHSVNYYASSGTDLVLDLAGWFT